MVFSVFDMMKQNKEKSVLLWYILKSVCLFLYKIRLQHVLFDI